MKNAQPSTTAMNFSDAANYVLGGNALFTVKNTKTGNHMTYKVQKPKDERTWEDDKTPFFVRVARDYMTFNYIGLFNKERFKFTLTKASKAGKDSPSVIGFQCILTWLYQTKRLPDNVQIFHHGTCGRCGRTLTDPESIERGLGSHCAGIISKSQNA